MLPESFVLPEDLPVGYNVAVCIPPISPDDTMAWTKLDELIDLDGSVAAALEEFYRRLTVAYPCICDLPEGAVEDSVWTDGPLWSNFGHRVAVLGIVENRVDEVVPFVVVNASSLGLTVFDWTGATIYRPH